MPVYFLGISIFGIQCACQTSFISLGQAKVSLFIALLRKIILLIPLAIILPKFMCGANRRCNLRCDDKCCIYLYDEKSFA